MNGGACGTCYGWGGIHDEEPGRHIEWTKCPVCNGSGFEPVLGEPMKFKVGDQVVTGDGVSATVLRCHEIPTPRYQIRWDSGEEGIEQQHWLQPRYEPRDDTCS